MAPSIDVTPAGTNLFQVDVHDDASETTNQTTFEVAVTSDFLDRLEMDEHASAQDLVFEAARFMLRRTDDPDEIENRVSLDDLAERYPSFTDHVQAALSGGAARPNPVDQQHHDGRRDTDADARLIEETEQAQASGQASTPEERF